MPILVCFITQKRSYFTNINRRIGSTYNFNNLLLQSKGQKNGHLLEQEFDYQYLDNQLL